MTEPSRKVAIQGELGAFSHEAAKVLLGGDVDILPRPTFDALFEAVVSGAAWRAVVPIENSLAGTIHENYDRLAASGLRIVAESQLRIRHCLLGRPGASLATVRQVASHPVALAQCRRFFAERPHIEALTAYDTAGSVKDLLRDGPDTRAAIASRLAADIYGAQVMLEDIEDDPENYTRFLLISPEPVAAGPTPTKTTIVFTLAHEPGALHSALGVFASRGVDLTKIESRPLRGQPWEYLFYVDVVGDPAGAAGAALQDLAAIARDVRVLGSYPDGLRRRQG
jgi:prephenate dehydratase